MTRIAHHLLRGVLLIGFSLFILFLVRTDQLSYYIAPRMALYVKLSALLLYILAAGQLYQAYKLHQSNRTTLQHDCGCEHIPSGFPLKSVFMYVLFALPLLLGTLLPNTVLGSAMADQKGMRLTTIASNPSLSHEVIQEKDAGKPKQTPADVKDEVSPHESSGINQTETTDLQQTNQAIAPNSEMESGSMKENSESVKQGNAASSDSLEELFPSSPATESFAKYARSVYDDETILVEEKSFTEILTTLHLYLDAFIGKPIEITGFIYRMEPMEPHQFAIGRFAMTCCSADAEPYGVFAEFVGAEAWPDDQWVKVKGSLSKTVFNEAEIMKLDVKSIEKTEAPKEPYVYPNWDFGSE
ncbi:TIGR03943 family putative permease subunit [Marinicrinis lubricantis]|uniref:TIGR03943 family putative permease subunit n=1 Tax=Marinicrinis lubricantis TaxID=2086470 RepID=A0ABW1IK66_9BACL